MAEKTAIAWTNRTWNPWRGCTKVSPGCKNCYMFTAQERYGRDPKIVTRTKTWGDAMKWQRDAAAAGRTELVFTCSWSDWFHADADAWRDEAWQVVRNCPNLIFQILTKRIERAAECLPADWGDGYPNVWLGTSIESGQYAVRADNLRKIPAVVRFISYEPALGPLDDIDLTGIDWLIYGGESGPGYRPEGTADDPKRWARGIMQRCAEFGTAFFHKQSAAARTEMGIELDGLVVRNYPTARIIVPSAPAR